MPSANASSSSLAARGVEGMAASSSHHRLIVLRSCLPNLQRNLDSRTGEERMVLTGAAHS